MHIPALFMLTLFSPLIWAQEALRGDMHAVINPNGSISYYLKVSPEAINTNTPPPIDKFAVKQLVSDDKTAPKAFELIGSKDNVAGYYVSPASSSKNEPVELAINQGYTAKAVPYDSLPESFDQAYKFANPQGEIGGAWLPVDESAGASALGQIIPTDWSTSRLGPTSNVMLTSTNVPVPEDEFIESLRETMLKQAISLACKSKITPKEITVSASLAASVGFIVSGEGTVSFQAMWETATLCAP